MLLKIKTLFCLLQAVLMAISHVSVYDSNFKRWADRAALSVTGVEHFSFAPIEAEAIPVTASEKARCRAWFDRHIRTAASPAYDFTVGNRSLQKHLSDWEITVGAESAAGAVYRSGKTTEITLRHKKSGLQAAVEATIYEDYATCEWTVRLVNAGSSDSPAVRDLCGVNCALDMGRATLYVSKGSSPAADDFTLVKTAVSPTTMSFNANGGRSESFLPYFNLCGETYGAVMAVGWTGQWYASLRQGVKGVQAVDRQEFLNAKLLPGECVRSPLTSLTFYEGGNALKGFESFRRWELDCVFPENAAPLKGYVIANEFNTLTCDELIAQLDTIDPTVMEHTDYFWMDAGWYQYHEGWHDGVGNWTPDPARFPASLKPLSDAMAARGKRFLLWYEPERVREGTALYDEAMRHADWIVGLGDNLMWNLASDGACDFLTDRIARSLLENGVSIYRQDFNFTPLEYWRKADKEFYGGRTGIAENHYVTNLYRYLDGLASRVDGLLIDNCASGGKRLDLEMSRRSVPFWRSDYNCGDAEGNIKPDVLEATQAMTAGLSVWLPMSGTNQYYHSSYAIRSAILTNPSVYEPDPAQYVAYDQIRAYMTENYFPLALGGTDPARVLAMQFGSADAGAALVYFRADVKESVWRLKLNGLSPARTYTLTDPDDPSFSVTATGKTLMYEGIDLPVGVRPRAAIVLYAAS